MAAACVRRAAAAPGLVWSQARAARGRCRSPGSAVRLLRPLCAPLGRLRPRDSAAPRESGRARAGPSPRRALSAARSWAPGPRPRPGPASRRGRWSGPGAGVGGGGAWSRGQQPWAAWACLPALRWEGAWWWSAGVAASFFPVYGVSIFPSYLCCREFLQITACSLFMFFCTVLSRPAGSKLPIVMTDAVVWCDLRNPSSKA